jgi:hypothetical protein
MPVTTQNQGSSLPGTVHDHRRRVLELLGEVFGNAGAQLFLRTFNPELRGRPADLMATKDGSAAVARYLEKRKRK